MAKRWIYRSVIIIFGSSLVCCLLIPYYLLYLSNWTIETVTLHKTTRKALDFKQDTSSDVDRYNNLKFQIAELEHIKVSVRNELLDIEKERYRIVQETESYKGELYHIQFKIADEKKQLTRMNYELLKTGHELYSATTSSLIPATKPPPIIILPPLQDTTQTQPLGTQSHIPSSKQWFKCQSDINSCLDFSRCPLSKSFKFYIYTVGSFTPSILKFKYPELLTTFIQHLQETDSLTENPNEACFFLVILGPFERLSSSQDPIEIENLIYALPYWGQDGINHVLINFSGTRNILKSFNALKAIVVEDEFTVNWRRGFDMIVPHVTTVLNHLSLWKHLPPIVPANRKYFIHFLGEMSKSDWLGDVLKQLTNQIKETVDVQMTCLGRGDVTGVSSDGEWSLCGTKEQRSMSLTQSTFSIVPIAGNTGLVRLEEALMYGAIPVIFGNSALPFEAVVDWNEVAIFIPLTRLHEIHYIIRSISTNRILELRRQGRVIWEIYFSSLFQQLLSITSILRYRMFYPPPSAPGVVGNLKKYGHEVNISSPVYQNNFSIYNHRFWNNPPGPFYTYPHIPWSPSPISGSKYATMSTMELHNLPPHIVQGGGITGPYFGNYLLGDQPMEYFTVVMLTYKREDVVLESVLRLDDVSYLAKIIVVWNDIDNSPFDIKWPKLSIPLEVIWAEKNSLNNRFLPFNSIQTEAVLSIDDDVYLRPDEIQFGFRVWRESRERLVGFPGRFHSFDVRNRKWNYNSNYTCELSMVLTGAAFFHKYYTYLYTLWQPKAILDLIDDKLNCEDIAMNFLISHITRKPPLKITSRWTFRCPDCQETLSQSEVHFNERHECVNVLTQIYGYMPLLYTQFRLDSVLFKTRISSHLEKCYAYV